MSDNPHVTALLQEMDADVAAAIGPPPIDPSLSVPQPLPTLGSTPGATAVPTDTPVAAAEFKAFVKAVDEQNNRMVSPALKRLGEIARMVPGAEVLRVYKMTGGKLAHVTDLTMRDVKTSGGDLEAHLNKHVRPTYKGGDYHIQIVDPTGKMIPAGMISFLDPPDAPQNESALGLLRDMIARQEQARMNQPPPTDPLDQLVKMQTVMKQLQGPNGENKSPFSLESIMMMKVMGFDIGGAPRQPTADPQMLLLLERLAAKQEALEKQLAVPPPPPLPPPEPQGLNAILAKSSLADVASVIGTIVAMTKKDPTPPDPNALTLRDLIPLLKPEPDPDRIGVREIIQLMDSRRMEEKPAATLHEQMQTLMQFKDFTESFSGPPAPQGSTFWDALGQLFSQEQFGAGLGKALGSAIGAPKPSSPTVVQNRPAPRQVQNGAPAGSLPPAEAPIVQEPPQPQLPPDIQKYTKEIERGQNDAERVQATVVALSVLRNHPHWKETVDELFQRAVKNDAPTAMHMLKNVLGFLVSRDALNKEAALATVNSFQTNWAIIHAQIAQRFGQPVQANGSVAATAPSAANAASASASASPPPSPSPVIDTHTVDAPRDEDEDEDSEDEDEDDGDEDDGDEDDEQEAAPPIDRSPPQIIDLPADLDF